MKYAEMHGLIRTLVGELARHSPEQTWEDVDHLLDYGQDDEAMDVLIATIVRCNVMVTEKQRETLRTLMGEFEFTDESRQHYRYLADLEMLDRMTVVDEPSS